MDNGFHNLSWDDYKALQMINSSALKQIARCPMDYSKEVTHIPKVLDLGSATHMFILENDIFWDHYCVIPEGMRRDKRSKAYKEFQEENEGKKVLSASEFEMIEGMNHAFDYPEHSFYIYWSQTSIMFSSFTVKPFFDNLFITD